MKGNKGLIVDLKCVAGRQLAMTEVVCVVFVEMNAEVPY